MSLIPVIVKTEAKNKDPAPTPEALQVAPPSLELAELIAKWEQPAAAPETEIPLPTHEKTPILPEPTSPVEDSPYEIFKFEKPLQEQPAPICFEASITAYSKQETTPKTLKTIQEQAPEQPIEQSFVQLAAYLAEAPVDNPEATSIRELVIEIANEIQTLLATTTPSELLVLPPELSSKIMILLEEIGYPNPGEVLATCLATHNMTFLLDGLQYLAIQAGQEDKPEIQHATTNAVYADDTSLPTRLGRLILSLIRASQQSTELIS